MFTAIARAVALPYVLHIHDYDYAADVCARGGCMQGLVREHVHRGGTNHHLGDGGGGGPAGRARAAGRRPSWFSRTRCPIRVSRRGWRRRGRTEPAAPRFLGHLSARKGVPRTLGSVGEPVAGRSVMARDARRRRAVDEFRARAAALGLADRVAFPGWIDQSAASALCAAADILVLPSHAEGLAMSVLEGLAHGLAVVTTPVGAHAEVIEPEQSGLFMPPGDIAALGAALARVIGDTALRKRLGAGARQRFLDRFEIRSYSVVLSRLHVGLLGGRRVVGGD